RRALGGRALRRRAFRRRRPGRRLSGRSLRGRLAGRRRLALALGEQLQRLAERNRVGRRRLGDRCVDLAPVDVTPVAAFAHGDRATVGMLADQAPGDAAAGGFRLDEREGVVERDARRVGSFRQGRVDLAVADVGAEPALLDADRAALRMLAEKAAGTAAEARAAGAALLGDDEVDRAVGADFEHVVVAAEVGVGLAVLDIGAVPADAGQDRLAARRMPRHLARQREEREGILERHVLGLQATRQRGSFRLLALALLHVVAEAAAAQRDLFARFRVFAEHAHAWTIALAAFGPARRQDAGVFALGIVRAADEGAELAELQRQLPLPAHRAEAGVDAVAAVGKDVRPEELVEAVEHLARAQVLDVADGAVKVVPEVAQKLLPVDLAVRDLVELLLEVGGEVVADVFGEEGLEESRHQPALVLRDEPLLLEPHVVAFAQDGDGRGVGRGAADAELFHPFDERRLGVARRRLGEMLARVDPLLG